MRAIKTQGVKYCFCHQSEHVKTLTVSKVTQEKNRSPAILTLMQDIL